MSNMEFDLPSFLGSMCAFGFIYEGAIGQLSKTTSLCDHQDVKPLQGRYTWALCTEHVSENEIYRVARKA